MHLLYFVKVFKKMSSVKIIADSLNPQGKRLTSYLLEYPRFIHAEVMTHRCFSKNAASSRAIPIEKMIKQVIDNPSIPSWWGKNQGGMQAKEELSDEKNILIENLDYVEYISLRDLAKEKWIHARNVAIQSVRDLNSIGLHKQISNRILEPWFNIRVILSGTDFENFFSLRAHPDAQPEFQKLAYYMLDAYNKSNPTKLKAGEWHIPFGDDIDEQKLRNEIKNTDLDKNSIEQLKIKIATARCARVSYFNFEGNDSYEKDIKTCNKLFGSVPRHLSPTEHVAQAMDSTEYMGNFCGFKQYRYFFDDQNLKDSRIEKK